MHKILVFPFVTLHDFVGSKRNRPFSVGPVAPAQYNLLLIFCVLLVSVICWCLVARNRYGTLDLVRQMPTSMSSFPWLSAVSVCGSGCFAFFLPWMKTWKDLGYCLDLEVSILTSSFLWVGKWVSGSVWLDTEDVAVIWVHSCLLFTLTQSIW